MLTLKKAPRGLTHYANAMPSVASGIILMVALSAWLYWQDIWIFREWSDTFKGVASLFGVDASMAMSWLPDGGLGVSVTVPGTMPSIVDSCLIAIAAAALCAGFSYVISPNRVPARYSLRAVALILGLPALGFMGLSIDPELNVAVHVAQLFKLGYWFMLGAPLVYAVTGFVLPGNLVTRLLITIASVTYFYFSVPILALFHWQVLVLAGAAWAPFLNVLFSVLLFSLQLVAFYGMIAAAEE